MKNIDSKNIDSKNVTKKLMSSDVLKVFFVEVLNKRENMTK